MCTLQPSQKHVPVYVENEVAEEPNVEAGPPMAPEDPEANPPEVLSEDDQKKLRKIRLIHSNLGHPNQETFLRLLREAYTSERTLQLARQFECPICRQRGRKAPVRPSAVQRVTQLWDTVSVDTFWWNSPLKNERNEPVGHCVGISFFDEASDFQVCCIVRKGTSHQKAITGEEFKEAFLSSWLRVLPKPCRIRYDAEGFLRGLSLI